MEVGWLVLGLGVFEVIGGVFWVCCRDVGMGFGGGLEVMDCLK